MNKDFKLISMEMFRKKCELEDLFLQYNHNVEIRISVQFKKRK